MLCGMLQDVTRFVAAQRRFDIDEHAHGLIGVHVIVADGPDRLMPPAMALPGFATDHIQVDLDAYPQIRADLSNRVAEIFKTDLGIGPGVAAYDIFAPPADQLINAQILKVPAV